MKAFPLPLLMLILILVFGITISCDESRGNIEGIMTDESDKPVAGAIIRAERVNPPTQLGALIRTDESGHYSFSNIPVGKWEIEFYDKYGWMVGVEDLTVRANETITLDFTIGAKPLPPGLPKKIEYNLFSK